MLWFNTNIKHLPLASGQYLPGCSDIMLDFSKNGLFLRVFYPTNAKNNNKDNKKKWIPWIPDFLYIAGISRVIRIPLCLLRLVFWWYGNFHVPVLYGEKIRTEENLKCIIFSHGLGGARFLYSTICSDLASHGFLVACLEHRDNSSCHTFYYNNKEDLIENKQTLMDFQYIETGKNHYEKRNAQIKIRSSECIKAIEFLKNLNNGKVPENILENIEKRNKDYNFHLDDLIGKIDVNNFTLMGHSFGAATVLNTLPNRPEIKLTILLDPWMFPIKNENLHTVIDIPLLFINTQTFHIENNVKGMEKFMIKENRKMFTIRQTTHENQTDTVLVGRYWLNFFMKKIDPYQAIKINNALILKFLHKYINTPTNIDTYKTYLDKNGEYFEEGLTKPWKN